MGEEAANPRPIAPSPAGRTAVRPYASLHAWAPGSSVAALSIAALSIAALSIAAPSIAAPAAVPQPVVARSCSGAGLGGIGAEGRGLTGLPAEDALADERD